MRAAPAVVAIAAVAAALLVGAGRAGSGRTLAVSGAVASISAEGGLVAAHVHPAHGCDYALVWSPSSQRVRRIEDCSESNAVLQDLTLVPGGPIWWDWSSGNHVYCDDVYLAGHALGICSGADADTYYEFAGDGSLVAVIDYSVCQADCTDENGNLLPDGDYAVEVRRLRAGKLVPLLPPVNFRVFLDARNWRVTTIEPKAALTVYDASGKKLWSRGGVTAVYGGWIAGNTVVLHQTQSVHVYSAAGDGPVRPLPRGAVVSGVVGGLVVYVTGSTIRVLRLSDGRDRKLATANGLAGVELTPAGLFYGQDVPVKRGSRGLVTYVPMRTVLQLLR